jgi:tagaturonate reductase
MQLSSESLKKIKPQPGITIPDSTILALPEKVLQFGTGILLRGLPDYFIDKANKQGIFNGRVVIVKSTSKGSTDEFGKQDGLYTLCVKGITDGQKVEETIINASVSRVLSAGEEWNEILKCAHNPEIKLIISNTTEVGITLTDDDISLSPPQSFPGKLLAFLYERYKTFQGGPDSGMVIVPTELITENGDKLLSIVLELAKKNNCDTEFTDWIINANHFCNSLVDRIVPGKLTPADQEATEKQLGYTDQLMIMAEPFRLWVIESAHPEVKEILSFSKVDEGVVITPDIEKFRELKLRLLNGTHSFSCATAILNGFTTVKEAMGDEEMSSLIHQLMTTEIATAMNGELIPYKEACTYAATVMDRFKNPFLEHKWISISMNYTSKMKMRNVPLVQQYYKKTGKIPPLMALGFAAYLVFMKCQANGDKRYHGSINGQSYAIDDESAGYFAEQWASNDVDRVVDTILANKELWGTDLTALPGFAQVVKENIKTIQKDGIASAMRSKQQQKTVA